MNCIGLSITINFAIAMMIQNMTQVGLEYEEIQARLIAVKEVVKPSLRREMATTAMLQYKTSIRVICRTFDISESCFRYQPKLSTKNLEIAD